MKTYSKAWFWVLVAVIAVLGYAGYKKASHSVNVKTERVERRGLDFTVSATSMGTVKSDMEVLVSAERSGRISKLFVVEGDEVSEGDGIAELDPKEAEVNLRLSEASLEMMKARLSEMKAALKSYRVEVQSGIRKAEAGLAEAENRYRSMDELYKKGYLSSIEYNAAKRDYDVARAAYDSALSGNDALRAREEEIKAQEAAVKEAVHKLSLARIQYGYSFINSPVSGIVSSRPVELGQTVTKGTLVAVLISTGSLYVEASIDEADIGKVKLGQDVLVEMDAYPERIFRGRTYKISPVVLGGRQESRTFELRVRLDDSDVTIKPGMSADVEVIVDTVADALVVPSQAVVLKEEEKFVYLVEGGKARLREVKTGLSDWTFTQVLSGLREGNVIVVTPDVPELGDGSRISATAQK